MLGHVTVSNGDTVYGTLDLVAVSNVERSELLYRLDQIKQFFSRAEVKLGLLVLLVVVLFLLLRWCCSGGGAGAATAAAGADTAVLITGAAGADNEPGRGCTASPALFFKNPLTLT